MIEYKPEPYKFEIPKMPEIKFPETPKPVYEIRTINVLVTKYPDSDNKKSLSDIMTDIKEREVLRKYGVEEIMKYK